jgi:hypothetical protein
MSLALWLVLAWIGGTAAILGSLMTLGSLVLLVAPSQPRSHNPQPPLLVERPWQQQLKLLAVSLAMALAGFGILVIVLFPSF